MNEEVREQMLNVMFGTSSKEELPINESEEQLEEGVMGNIARAAGTGIKHAAQNAANNFVNGFAVTAKQKAQAANRTATLKANQAAEKAGNKAIAQAGKAGKASYKNVMGNWTIKNANEAMNKALAAQDMDTLIAGLEYALCGINVLDAGKRQGDTAGAEKKEDLKNAQNSNNQLGKEGVQNAKQQKTDAIQANQNVSGNEQKGNNGGQN